jgi:gliding motility associated protien GldN
MFQKIFNASLNRGLIHLFSQFIMLICATDLLSQNKPVAFEHVREADIMWSKKLYRIIDMREKSNLPFFFPLEKTNDHCSLFDALLNGVLTGKLVSYANENIDWSLNPLNRKNLLSTLIQSDSVIVYDVNENGEEFTYKKWVSDTIHSEEILQYWVGEIWYFDSKRSCIDYRILELCPVKFHEDKQAYQPLFWIDFYEAREWLDNFKAVSLYNAGAERSFEEIISKHMFIGPIKKEENIFNREINEFANGIDILLEGEKIKERIYNFESDRWEY